MLSPINTISKKNYETQAMHANLWIAPQFLLFFLESTRVLDGYCKIRGYPSVQDLKVCS